MCLADTVAAAEDLATQTKISFDPLPAIVDMVDAAESPPALVHEQWGDNVILDSFIEESK